jgi:hypothetical protein
MNSAISRLRHLGRDRFWNRYWWFDGGLGAYPFELVTHGIELRLRPLQKINAEGVVRDWASGLLIVEDFGLDKMGNTPEEEERKIAAICGEGVGKWGYYSTSEEVIFG